MRHVDAAPDHGWTALATKFIGENYQRLLLFLTALCVSGVLWVEPIKVAAHDLYLRRAGSTIGTRSDFTRNLLPVGNILLRESPSVLNVSPRVQMDPAGGFLVADADEAQVRRYAGDGRLLTVFGRKGRGPGEFTRLTAAVRTSNNAIAAVEIDGRLSLFDESGTNLLRTWRTGLGPVYTAARLGDSAIVLAGRIGGRMETDLLHVWDVRQERVVHSFFHTPAAPRRMRGAYALAGTSGVAVRGDTIAAVFALTDSVFLHSGDGRLLESIHIPFQHFRPAVEPLPMKASLSEYREWGSKFSAISKIFWTANGDFLIQYYDTDGLNPAWRLLRMDRQGRRVFELIDSPELLAVSAPESRLFFIEPSTLTPNRWLTAEFRP